MATELNNDPIEPENKPSRDETALLEKKILELNLNGDEKLNSTDDEEEEEEADDEDSLATENRLKLDAMKCLSGSTNQNNNKHFDPNSLESYLAKFTSNELLSDKIVCDRCSTTRSNKVYTNATKQYLVFELPAVLTIHLKRFQQHGWHLEKSNKFVCFPLTLDMSPFTSQMCVNKTQAATSTALYALYGIVEHSGRLNSGHYTAYVRARDRGGANVANSGGDELSLIRRVFLGKHRLCHLKSAIQKWKNGRHTYFKDFFVKLTYIFDT